MKLWLVVPLFALAQASCYDYEYYDPDTGNSLPGNACAKQQAGATAGATIGQPVVAQAGVLPQASTSAFVSSPVVGTTTYGALATPFASSAPVATTFGSSVYGTPAVVASTPVYGASTTVYGAASPAVIASTPVYGAASPAVVASTPVYGAATTVYGAASPAAVSVSYGTPAVAVTSQVSASARVAATGNGNANNGQLSAQLQYYKRLGEQQQREHRQNKRIVDQASRELSRGSLINQIVAGSGNVAPWYPAYRLSAQRDAAGAYKSEARIANKNANDAYQRYQQNPTRLNLLVSKYQDLNADLRDAAYHYNVVNSGTFGQITRSASLFGFGNLGLLGGLTQIVTQRQESNDLNDIQRQMQRVARQIQVEAKAAQSGSSTSASVQAQAPQGSVQQRMMAMSVYGPNRG